MYTSGPILIPKHGSRYHYPYHTRRTRETGPQLPSYENASANAHFVVVVRDANTDFLSISCRSCDSRCRCGNTVRLAPIASAEESRRKERKEWGGGQKEIPACGVDVYDLRNQRRCKRWHGPGCRGWVHLHIIPVRFIPVHSLYRTDR
jgi:hypothetical protein